MAKDTENWHPNKSNILLNRIPAPVNPLTRRLQKFMNTWMTATWQDALRVTMRTDITNCIVLFFFKIFMSAVVNSPWLQFYYIGIFGGLSNFLS